jgi:hypothetical protein
MLSFKMTRKHTPLRTNPASYSRLFNTFHTPIFGSLQTIYFQRLAHSSKNNPGYSPESELQAKPRSNPRASRLAPCSPVINPIVTHVSAIRPYHSQAQIHRNNFPHRASELLTIEVQGRRTWPIGSKAK